MALFLSTTINKIDKKGRVSVPASFRNALQPKVNQSIVLFRSLKLSILEGCGYDRMVKLSEHHDQMSLEPHSQNSYQSLMFAEAQLLIFDAEGRISLPPFLMEHADLTESVAFVGRGATFEMWQPEKFNRYHEELRQQMQSQARGSNG